MANKKSVRYPRQIRKEKHFGFNTPISNKVAYSVISAALLIGLILVLSSLLSLFIQINILMRVSGQDFIVEESETGESSYEGESSDNVLTVKVKANGNKQRVFYGDSEDTAKMSLLDILDEINTAQGLTIDYSEDLSSGKKTIKNIDGVDVTNHYELTYYINGRQTPKDPSVIKAGIGDVVELKTQ